MRQKCSAVLLVVVGILLDIFDDMQMVRKLQHGNLTSKSRDT